MLLKYCIGLWHVSVIHKSSAPSKLLCGRLRIHKGTGQHDGALGMQANSISAITVLRLNFEVSTACDGTFEDIS